MVRTLWFSVGWLCMALAVAGAVLPLLPCTPFALLSAVCFARSSPRALYRLRRSPFIGPVLRDWERYRGMRLHAKVTAVAVAIVAPSVTFAVNPQLSLPLLISAGGGLVAIGIVCWLPTIRADLNGKATDAQTTKGGIRRAA